MNTADSERRIFKKSFHKKLLGNKSCGKVKKQTCIKEQEGYIKTIQEKNRYI